MIDTVASIWREIMLVRLSLDNKSSLKLIVFLELLLRKTVLFKEQIRKSIRAQFRTKCMLLFI